MTVMPEITWSLMHPVAPDPAYMRRVIAAASHYHVDSFEICGDVHGSGGNLDGAILFRDYPAVNTRLDANAVERTTRNLREVVELAHASGRPVYYWHREVMVPRAIVESIPGLIDEHGEFDLLGDAYRQLVRSKIREFFERVPSMDGIVLTLTESDYSVIHNSDPKRYPPVKVVAQLVTTFAEELRARGKRFILRSFGSIAQDYEDILTGAAAAAAGGTFEIETKITPYDFSPFLPFNPYLKRTPGCTLSAEYDSIGEFLGAGFLPAPDPARVLAGVAYARAQGVDRHVIRVDRIGHATFESPQQVNLAAYDRAIRDPEITADEVWGEWAQAHWPECPAEMASLMQRGIEMVKKTHFINGSVIFHAFPIQPELKWVQACGILSVFQPGQSLAEHVGMWGMETDRVTPSTAVLLREKDEAVALAEGALADLARLRGRLSASEYALAEANWRRAVVATRAIRAWCRAVLAYCADMEQNRPEHPALTAALEGARTELAGLVDHPLPHQLPSGAGNEHAHEYGGAEPAEDSVEAAYVRPIWRQLLALPALFSAELRERARWRARPGIRDFVLPGGIVDDIRVHRYMHASHARLVGDRPARFVGNRVFPNGFVDVVLRRPTQGPARLVIAGDAGAAAEFSVSVDGRPQHARFTGGEFACDVPADGSDAVRVRMQKQGAEYPAIFGLGLVAAPPVSP